jgi:rhodanese-related sulfurtransferase
MEASMGDFFIDAAELRRSLAAASAPIVIDVRRRAVYDKSDRILPTARWREHTTTRVWGRDLPKGTPVVTYCVHGHNVSQLAAAELRAMGYDARALAGGIDEGWSAAGHPTILKAALPGRDESAPSRWITRVRPKIDRIACPWLIARFIDRDAIFQFVDPPYVLDVAKEAGGIAYDIDGAPFTHDGPLCTFDTLIRAFGLADTHLDRLASIVRGADTARLDLAPEAAGLLAVSLGISAQSGGDDHAALARGFPVYDALYAWARDAAGESHNWPAKTT